MAGWVRIVVTPGKAMAQASSRCESCALVSPVWAGASDAGVASVETEGGDGGRSVDVGDAAVGRTRHALATTRLCLRWARGRPLYIADNVLRSASLKVAPCTFILPSVRAKRMVAAGICAIVPRGRERVLIRMIVARGAVVLIERRAWR